ncbi:MAG: tetratricopeptide repeat protein [Candidatus Riflebacteria bacterium]|nr:tetratricopeptide repeat protein [Candidatus Riflebacteria bacterium]
MKRKRTGYEYLFILLIFAGGVRFAYIAEQINDPFFRHPGVDAEYNRYWARGLAFGDWKPPTGRLDPHISDRAFFKPPGYPAFLATIYRIFGDTDIMPRLVQIGFGLANLILLFTLAKRLFDTWTGLIATGLCAFSPSLVFYEGELLEPTPFITICLLLLLILTLSLRRADDSTPETMCSFSVSRAGISGIVLGIGSLIRPNLLVFAPFAAWHIFRTALHHSAVAEATKFKAYFNNIRRTCVKMLAFCAGITLIILPVTLRNATCEPGLVLLSANGGLNLYLGNHPGSDGISPAAADFEEWTCFDWPHDVAVLSRKYGRAISSAEASDEFTSRAIIWIVDNPGQFLTLLWRKTLLFWGPLEITNAGNREDEFEIARSSILRKLPVHFSIIFAMALFGIWKTWRNDLNTKLFDISSNEETNRKLLIYFIVSIFVSYLPFFIAGRFRAPIIPVLAIFSAVGLMHIVKSFLLRNYASMSLAMMIFILVSVNWSGYNPDFAQGNFLLGLAWAGKSDFKKASACYEDAIRINPAHARAHTNLGAMFLTSGNTNEAAKHFEAALRVRPAWATALYNIGLLRIRQGKPADALSFFERATDVRSDHVPALCELGKTLCRLGRSREAISPLRAAVSLEPDNPELLQALGLALCASGDTSAAIPIFRKAVSIKRDFPAAMYNLALALDVENNLDDAIKAYREMLSIATGDADAMNNLAVTLFRKGDIIGARDTVASCRSFGIEPHPEFLAALASSSGAASSEKRLPYAR